MLALLVAAKIAFNVAALLGAGLAAQAALGVILPSRTQAMLRIASAASVMLILMAGARIALLNAQLGEGLAASILRWRIVAAAGALAVAASFPLTGHISGPDIPLWLQTLLGLHVLIAAFWVAAPLTLWPLRQIDDSTLTRRLRRFSLIATAAIPVLLATGLLIALLLAGGFSGLTSTAYGQLLLVKLAVTLTALAAGAINRQVITARMAVDPFAARRWLRLTLSVEATAFVAAIVVVSLATTVWPPAYI